MVGGAGRAVRRGNDRGGGRSAEGERRLIRNILAVLSGQSSGLSTAPHTTERLMDGQRSAPVRSRVQLTPSGRPGDSRWQPARFVPGLLRVRHARPGPQTGVRQRDSPCEGRAASRSRWSQRRFTPCSTRSPAGGTAPARTLPRAASPKEPSTSNRRTVRSNAGAIDSRLSSRRRLRGQHRSDALASPWPSIPCAKDAAFWQPRLHLPSASELPAASSPCAFHDRLAFVDGATYPAGSPLSCEDFVGSSR